MVCTVAIPWLTGRAVDHISDGDRAGLRMLAVAVVGVALARLGLSVLRRLVAGQVSLAIEYDLRTLLYEHLQRLELGFFAGQQTGQLMSRATVDLSSVRFFLGYGLVFILQSGLTILLAAVAMLALQPFLAVLALLPVPFVVLVAARYGRGFATLAIKQARGDLIEAAFLLRAYRTPLPRFAASEPLDTGAMRIRRRISATYKDLPGGQVLGPTF